MFVKFIFSKQQIDKYFQAAERDLFLAANKEPEIKFQFSYNSLLKLAQAVCAKQNLRVKARTGHHMVLFDKCAELLDDGKIAAGQSTHAALAAGFDCRADVAFNGGAAGEGHARGGQRQHLHF